MMTPNPLVELPALVAFDGFPYAWLRFDGFPFNGFPFGSGLITLGWLLGWVLLWRLPRLDPDVRPDTGRRISVVIPARNEADRLPRLLAGLRGQTRPADEVIVVDDGSTDATAQVAARVPMVRVIAAPPVPEGWTGKSWACHTGALAATGHLLVFLDADVELAPGALAAVVHRWEAEGGLVSVQPQHRIRRRVEALSLPFNVVTMMGLGVGSLARPRREWGAAGPCLVTGARDYWSVDGHRSVRREVAEDLALAERYADAGLGVRCVGGHDLIGFRMYRDLPGLVEGWTKNLATGATRTPWVRSLAVAAWLATLLTVALATVGPGAPVWTALGGRTLPAGVWEPDGLLTSAVAYALVAAQLAVQARQVGRFRAAALVWPVLLGGFVAVFAWSTVRTALVRQVRWNGRTIHLAARP